MSDIPTSKRDKVMKRSGGLCEACGMTGGHIHHRRRGNPREHDLSNLTRLCVPCHDTCTVRAWPTMTRIGFVLSRNEPSTSVPIALCAGPRLWTFLLDRGGYLIGGQTFGDIVEVHEALAAMRPERVGPADSLGAFQTVVPTLGIVRDGFLGPDDDSGLVVPVEEPSVEAGAFVQSGETVADFFARSL